MVKYIPVWRYKRPEAVITNLDILFLAIQVQFIVDYVLIHWGLKWF